jgi:hypothetical protein
MATIFGPRVDAAYVEEEIKQHLKNWLPTYLANMATDLGKARNTFIRDDGTAVGSWAHSTQFHVTDATALPAVLIINAGFAEPPKMEGDGSYRATWTIGIGGLVSAGGDNPAENSSRLAKRWGSIIAQIMLQADQESEYLEGVEWLDEGYDDVPPQEQRSLGSFRLVFAVEYRNVLNANVGPASPDPLPDPVNNGYPDWGQLPDTDHVHVEVQKEPLDHE